MEDLERIEYHLRFAKRPNALCTLLAARINCLIIKCGGGGVPKLGVPYWRPHKKVILLFGGLYEGSPILVNSQNATFVFFEIAPKLHCQVEVGRLLEGEIDELPDLTNAEKIMTDFKLDEDDMGRVAGGIDINQ